MHVFVPSIPLYLAHTYTMYCLPIIAEPLGEAGNRGARSRNAFVCMYVYMYIYIYPSQSTIVASIDCAIGKMVRPIRV